MDRRRFVDHRFGRLVKNPTTGWPHDYYLPEPIPRTLDLRTETNAAVSRADIALGRLSGVALLINDPEFVLGPSMAQEALSSSRIEGTQASLSDVLAAAADDTAEIRNEDLREVGNYLAAASQGVALLASLPITQRYFSALHETLLTGVRGEEKTPGEIRRSPVWIGAADARPETARFVPPHHSHLGGLLSDWEQFANEVQNVPPVVKSALLHYQFETIHPFLDGNGRIGRLLIGLGLVQDRVLPTPILYVSGYFEQNRDEYYTRLQAVRERGEIDEWIQFFGAAVEARATEGARRIGRLVELREKYRSTIGRDRSSLPAVADLMFRNPVLTVPALMRAAGIAQPTASAALHRAESIGWIRSVGRWGRGGREHWLAHEIWEVVTGSQELDA